MFYYLDITEELLREISEVNMYVKQYFNIINFMQVNFVGKLLGPKGNTMKQLQEETMCKMAILGRGSMRDR